MADLIDRAALLEKYPIDTELPAINIINSMIRRILSEAPAVDAMECNVFRRAINRECARLCHADEEMIKAMAGYNPSSFFAGFGYALDCVVSNLTLLPRERRTDETD